MGRPTPIVRGTIPYRSTDWGPALHKKQAVSWTPAPSTLSFITGDASKPGMRMHATGPAGAASFFPAAMDLRPLTYDPNKPAYPPALPPFLPSLLLVRVFFTTGKAANAGALAETPER